jgi:hypothetical protein
MIVVVPINVDARLKKIVPYKSQEHSPLSIPHIEVSTFKHF